MAEAAYKKKVRVSNDVGVTWLEVPTSSPSLTYGAEALDTTDLAPGASVGYRSRLLGLLDWSISCDSFYDPADAALTAIRGAMLSRTDILVQYLPEGTVVGGFQGSVVVETFSLSGEVAALETVAISLQANGALAAAT